MRRDTVSLRVQFKCGKIRTRRNSNTDAFDAVLRKSVNIKRISEHDWNHPIYLKELNALSIFQYSDSLNYRFLSKSMLTLFAPFHSL